MCPMEQNVRYSNPMLQSGQIKMEKKQHLLKLELHLANQSLHRGVTETNADTGVYTHFLILHYPPSASSTSPASSLAPPSGARACP